MTDPHTLIQGYLDDTLNDAEQAELTVWLKFHPDNLRVFVETIWFEQSIRDGVISQSKREAAEAFIQSEGTVLRLRTGWNGRLVHHWLRRFWLPLAAVITLTLLLAGAWLIHERRIGFNAIPRALGRVTLIRSVQVPDTIQPLQSGQELMPGRVVLLAGAMQMVLNNGVTIVFEGPGELELLSPMRALLHSGQAVVRVPDNAKGFQLDTAAAQVVDLGTEFGVKCSPGAISDVFVFDGKVLVSASGGRTGFPQQLNAGSATRFAPDQTNPTKITYRPERFVRRLPVDKPVELDESKSPLFNDTRYEEIAIARLEQPLMIDGVLSEWSRANSFRAVRNEVAGEFIEGRMCYDDKHLYIAAHIGDPAPMRNVVDPTTDGELGWRGGGLQVRLATDPTLGWPVEANSAAYYNMRRLNTDAAQVAKATNSHLVHLTMWHHAPSGQACLHLAYGMDFHGSLVNPSGYKAAYRKDVGGRGYTLEYAIPWTLLNAPRGPQPGDTLAMSWTAHWSALDGRLWRGQWVELRNSAEPLRIHTWERAATWGRAVFQ